MPHTHVIEPYPHHMVRGYFDAALPPVLSVASGDTVELTSWTAGDPHHLHPDRSRVDPLHLEALERCPRGPASHFVTGPVFVEGAVPGDVLQVDILSVVPVEDWGYTAVWPLLGTLPYDFEETVLIHPDLDVVNGTVGLPWGKTLPLAPFCGIVAVAPPPAWGRCSSVPPRKFGGNMDNKELRPGTTLYLPVFNEGALFCAGDGHAVQGDGEVCITAVEASVRASFRLTVRKDLDYAFPFAETPTHLMSIGLDEDLDDAARQAVREMIDHICRRTALTRAQAYMLCSLAGDLRVTQTVDEVKGCHMLLAKSAL